MATIALTKDSFEQVVKDNDMSSVDFWAPVRGRAKVSRRYSRPLRKSPDIVFGK